MRFRSLRTRLVAITVVLAAVGLIVAGIATYAALRSFLLDRVDRTLAASTTGVSRALTRGGPGGESAGLGQAGQLTPGLYVEVRDPNGRKLFGQALTPPGEPATHAEAAGDDRRVGRAAVQVSRRRDGRRLRLPRARRGAAVRHRRADPRGAARRHRRDPRPARADRGAGRRRACCSASPSSASSLIRRGLRPLERIEEDAAAIGAGDLSRRVEPDDETTEVGRLGHALNAMLGQIEGAFAERAASEERLRRFVSDASHELRTPRRRRARLRGAVRPRRPRPAGRPRARDGRDPARGGPDRRAGRRPAAAGSARPGPAAGARGRSTSARSRATRSTPRACSSPTGRSSSHVAGVVPVVGRRAAAAAGGRQPARERPRRTRRPARRPGSARSVIDGHAVLAVEDDGPGLDAEAAARVFERFYRVDASRARTAAAPASGWRSCRRSSRRTAARSPSPASRARARRSASRWTRGAASPRRGRRRAGAGSARSGPPTPASAGRAGRRLSRALPAPKSRAPRPRR